jgi:hypothetical protein
MSDGNGSKRELRSEAWFSGLNGERAGPYRPSKT